MHELRTMKKFRHFTRVTFTHKTKHFEAKLPPTIIAKIFKIG